MKYTWQMREIINGRNGEYTGKYRACLTNGKVNRSAGYIDLPGRGGETTKQALKKLQEAWNKKRKLPYKVNQWSYEDEKNESNRNSYHACVRVSKQQS